MASSRSTRRGRLCRTPSPRFARKTRTSAPSCAVTKRRDAVSLRAAWSGCASEHLSEILAKFESGLTSDWLPHRPLRGGGAPRVTPVGVCGATGVHQGLLLAQQGASLDFSGAPRLSLLSIFLNVATAAPPRLVSGGLQTQPRRRRDSTEYPRRSRGVAAPRLQGPRNAPRCRRSGG